jgi:hypothetical protein
MIEGFSVTKLLTVAFLRSFDIYQSDVMNSKNRLSPLCYWYANVSTGSAIDKNKKFYQLTNYGRRTITVSNDQI